MARPRNTRLIKALLETAGDMRRSGVLSAPGHAKITKRHLGTVEVLSKHPLSGDEIRALRKRSKMSQAVFAHYLNVTPGYVSQLERGAKRPAGPALALLNVIKRNGIQALL